MRQEHAQELSRLIGPDFKISAIHHFGFLLKTKSPSQNPNVLPMIPTDAEHCMRHDRAERTRNANVL